MHDLREPTGTSQLAIFLRNVVRAIRCNRILDGANYRVARTQNGVVLDIRPTGSLPQTPTTISCYKIVGHFGDYLTCHTWDGSVEGSTLVYVAKPGVLRFSEETYTWDTVTIYYSDYSLTNQERTATRDSDGYSEVECVVRPYKAGETIYAADVSTTGLILPELMGPCTILDLNVAARHWAKKWA